MYDGELTAREAEIIHQLPTKRGLCWVVLTRDEEKEGRRLYFLKKNTQEDT